MSHAQKTTGKFRKSLLHHFGSSKSDFIFPTTIVHHNIIITPKSATKSPGQTKDILRKTNNDATDATTESTIVGKSNSLYCLEELWDSLFLSQDVFCHAIHFCVRQIRVYQRKIHCWISTTSKGIHKKTA
jgi:hypothetical protein